MQKALLIALFIAMIGGSLIVVGMIRQDQKEVFMEQNEVIPPESIRYLKSDFYSSEKRFSISLDASGGPLLFMIMDSENFFALEHEKDYDSLVTKAYNSKTELDWNIPQYETHYFLWANPYNSTIQNHSTIYVLDSVATVPRAIPYFGLLLLLVLPMSLMVWKFDIKSSIVDKSTVRLTIGSVSTLLLLGFVDGITMKEGFWSNGLVPIGSIVGWILLVIPLLYLFDNSVKTEPSGGYVIWRDAFGVMHVDDAGEMFQGLVIFIIAAVIWFLPFVVIWLLL